MPPQTPPPPTRRARRSYALGIVIILVVVLGAFFIVNDYYGWFPQIGLLRNSSSSNDESLTAVAPAIAPLEGTLFMTLDKAGTRSLYRYNLLTKSLEKVIDLPKSDLSIPSEAVINHVLDGFAFVQKTSAGSRVMFALTSDGGKTMHVVAASTDKPVTAAIRSLSFSSDDNHLVYAESNDTSASPSAWTLKLLSGAKPSATLGQGVSPVFGSGSTVFFLKDDGIYAIDADATSSGAALVLGLSEVPSSEDSLAYSPDASLLAFSNASKGVITVFKVAYGDSITLTPISILTADAYNRPVFDAAGRFLVEKLFGTASAGTVPAARDVNGALTLPLVHLDGFDPNTVSIAGWQIVP